MNAKRLEISGRMAACAKWAWLPGMAYVSTRKNDKMRRGRLALAPSGGDCFKAVEDWYHGDEFEDRDPDEFGKWRWLPDLSDVLTRVGVLAVVRRAWGIDTLTTQWSEDGWYMAGVPDDVPGLWFSSGAPSEEEALLWALERAPA